VINEENGSYVVVQITDRGPYAKNRVIDVSLAAAEGLGMLGKGTVPVSLEVLGGIEATPDILAVAAPFGDPRLAIDY
jgi:rare lipoprotein A